MKVECLRKDTGEYGPGSRKGANKNRGSGCAERRRSLMAANEAVRGKGMKMEIDFEQVFTFENLMQAANDCQKGVRWKESTQQFEMHKLRWVASMRKQLLEGTYKGKGFNEFWICERGKMRFIQSVHISERCIQKTLSNHALKKEIVPTLIYDNSASIQNKGTCFAMERLKCHLERHYRRHGRIGGVLTMDFKNYFGSIDHEKLLVMLQNAIKDDKLFGLMKQFIDAFDGSEGLGLGSEVSQICAVAFPNSIDHFIKTELKIKGYGRYMDDSYIIHKDVEYLKECLESIKEKCAELGITLNEKRVKISKFEKESFTYLKKRIKLTESGKVVIRLSRTKITSQRRKMRKQKRMLDEGRIKIESIRRSYKTFRSTLEHFGMKKSIESFDKLYKDLFGEEVKVDGHRRRKGSKKTAGRAQQANGRVKSNL